eukprot:4383171-Pleurochrysis_carterae.AAC.1
MHKTAITLLDDNTEGADQEQADKMWEVCTEECMRKDTSSENIKQSRRKAEPTNKHVVNAEEVLNHLPIKSQMDADKRGKPDSPDEENRNTNSTARDAKRDKTARMKTKEKIENLGERIKWRRRKFLTRDNVKRKLEQEKTCNVASTAERENRVRIGRKEGASRSSTEKSATFDIKGREKLQVPPL